MPSVIAESGAIFRRFASLVHLENFPLFAVVQGLAAVLYGLVDRTLFSWRRESLQEDQRLEVLTGDAQLPTIR